MTERSFDATITKIARIVAANLNPWSKEGLRNPDDWAQHPVTDTTVRLWEVFIPLAEKLYQTAHEGSDEVGKPADQMERTGGLSSQAEAIAAEGISSPQRAHRVRRGKRTTQ
jgi:hypothetical protein